MKLWLLIGALFLSLCLALYVSLSQLFTARSELRHTNAQLEVAKAQVEAYSAYRTDAQQVLQEASANAAVIEVVLEENKDWGSTAVPDAVIAGLCKSSVCQTGKVQSPGNQPKH
jgi:hypothetical protein